MRQQQLIEFRWYGRRCQFSEHYLFREWTPIQNPYSIEHRWFFAEPHPPLTFDAMQFDDGDTKAPRSGNEGVPSFMHRCPVTFRIPQVHGQEA
jgi:hypothetical protein